MSKLFRRAGALAPLALVATLALAGEDAAPRDEAPQPAPCESDSAFRLLDFWLGEWDVMVGDRRVGTNRIEKILRGCAISEHWTDASGGQGKSLFYFDPALKVWKQVWVTDAATRPGGLKEKHVIATYADGSVRFQGEIRIPGAGSALDRTTLTPRPNGTVRQLIELSRDGGKTWSESFDATYVPQRK